MYKKIALLGSFALFTANFSFAEATSSWFKVTTGQSGIYSAKKGTFRYSKGESSVLFMYQTKDNKVEYYKGSIKDTYCDNGYGEMKFFNMDGRFAFKADYVAEGTSVGSALGDFMCGLRNESNSQ
ncbi:hypothetical protein [Raoultella ornithinolytica]|uniref:hypothetical protein n=1 Tax=Raoultella ornithinolytica TaxID=54291 RepID=UPI001F2E2066|nr:hypothetical protein [Raoultella ornithinolytica]MCF6713188.1 hypothetical protein [Raoultella ornithinolytica]